MKIKISREDLLHCLEYVIDATDSSNINPLLRHVLLQVDNNTLTMVATDHMIQMKTACKIKSTQTFEKIVPAAKLQSILSALDSDTLIEMSFGERNVTLKAGRSQFSLVTEKADNYSLLGATGKLEKLSAGISSADLLQALRKVHYAAAKESHRLCLSGILMEQTVKAFNLVATDAHRLAVHSTSKGGKDASKHILPKKTVDILLKRLQDNDKIEISKNDRVVHFKTEVFELTSNIIDENYPDYQSVIPRKNESHAVVERKPLLAMIRRVNALVEKDAVVIFSFKNGSLEIESSNKDNDSLQESLDIEYTGEEHEIGFNISYIYDVVNVLHSDKLSIKIKDKSASVLMEPIGGVAAASEPDDGDEDSGDGDDKKPEKKGKKAAASGGDFCYVVMPVRL